MKDVILVCEDMFGLEIYAIVEEINRWCKQWGYPERYHVLGCISDSEDPFGGRGEMFPRLGSIMDWAAVGDERYVLAIKMPEDKKRAVERLKKSGCQFETVIAPWTLMLPVPIGEGSVIAAYSITVGMTIGRYVTLVNSMVSDHYTIGDYSTILRASNVMGDVGEDTYVGNHVFSVLGKSIGDHCFVSDGSIVIGRVRSGNTVEGVPARKINR